MQKFTQFVKFRRFLNLCMSDVIARGVKPRALFFS